MTAKSDTRDGQRCDDSAAIREWSSVAEAAPCGRGRPALQRLTPSLFIAITVTVALSGCGSAPVRESSRIERPAQISKAPGSVPRSRGGGYYLDDGPGDSPPADLDSIPEPVPQLEPLHRGAMRPYVVMGQTYTPMTELAPYKARGVASWYGRRYHGKQTSTGEIYDMYSMTAAHPVLPLPSYVRVTNVATGKSVIVRVNDRGPFIDSRLIDLSYTAAYRLGVLSGGSALVDVESILPDALSPNLMVAAAPRARPSSGAATRRTPSPAAPQPALAATTSSQSVDPDPIITIAAATYDSDPGAGPAQPAQVQAQRLENSSDAPAPVAAATPGVYLQLAAFGSRDNAEAFLTRVRAQMEPLARLLHLFTRDGLYRVHAGPYSSSSEARQAAERIGFTLGTKPVLMTR